MKRISLLIVLLLVAKLALAQNPKAVFKSLAEGDIMASTERYEKISDKTREKMPEMCYLAEAALLNMPKQMGVNKLHGYEILSEHIDDIRNSANVEKTFQGLDIGLEQVISNIEEESFNYLMSLDTERNYVIYITWAKRGGHPRLGDIEQRLEELRYTHTMAATSTEDCDFFLATYPESKYRDKVAEHRTTLYYNEAMEHNDEALLESFIANYPRFKHTPEAKQQLKTLRYNRIFGEEATNLTDMKWFLKEYPDTENLAQLKQRMANIEFESLPSTSEMLSAFIDYYGDVEQRDEAQRRLHLARIAEYGSIRDFVEYIRTYGYDPYYSIMIRQIYQHSKRYILTPNLNDVTLIRYAAEDGNVGYMDFDGNMVIEPLYEAKKVVFGTGVYNRAMLSEFTPNRNIVAVSLHGAWGVINDKGEQIVENRYQALTIFNNQIYAVPDISAGESEYCDVEVFICDVYEMDGRFVKSGETTEWDGMPQMREFECNDGIERGRYLTPKYGSMFINGKNAIIDRDNNSYATNWNIISGVTDNIVVVEMTLTDGNKQRYFADLDSRELIKECPYNNVYPMQCGRAAVLVGDKYGFIDENLELVINPEFDIPYFTNSFNCGLMVVRNSDGVYGIINTEGEYLMTTNDSIVDMSVGYNEEYKQKGLFLISSGTRHTLIDTTGTIVATIESQYTPSLEGLELVSSDNTERVKLNFGEQQAEAQE